MAAPRRCSAPVAIAPAIRWIYAAGIRLRAAAGDRVDKGAPLLELHYNDARRLDEARALAAAALAFGPPPPPVPLVRAWVHADGETIAAMTAPVATLDLPERVAAAARFLRGRGVAASDVAIVLGSGLGAFADSSHRRRARAVREIPHWPASAVVGHAGALVAGRLRGRRVVALSGRAHLYEGHALDDVTFGMRVLGALGVPRVVLTNAAGGINTGVRARAR